MAVFGLSRDREGNTDKNPAETEMTEEARQQAARARYPKLFNDAPLMLISMGGPLLGQARLTSFSPWELCLGRLPGREQLPILQVGSEVRIQGQSESLEPFTMVCRVGESDLVHMVLTDLSPQDDLGRRAAFRYGVWRPAELVLREASGDGAGPEICSCELANLSMTGACVIGAMALDNGTPLRLRTELSFGRGQISFRGRVVRSRDLPDGKHEHGLLLAEMTRAKRRRLEADLRAMQDEAIRAAKM